MTVTITLVRPYDPVWRLQFEQLKAIPESVLGDVSSAVEHVGSTSVPGLVAKPIIDVDVVVAKEKNGKKTFYEDLLTRLERKP